MQKKTLKSKRCFQLLEVLVAVFLILLCAVPTLRIYTNMYKEQVKVVRLNERDHLVPLIHAKIIEQLYKRSLPLEDILAGMQTVFEDPDLREPLKRLSYQASYDLKIVEPKTEKGRENTSKYLAELIIKMKDLSQEEETHYNYLVYIDRGQRDKKGKQADPPIEQPLPNDAKKKNLSPHQVIDKLRKRRNMHTENNETQN